MTTQTRKGMKNVLLRRIERHTEAQIALSWAGSKDPDERDEIEERAAKATADMNSFIDVIFDLLIASQTRQQ